MRIMYSWLVFGLTLVVAGCASTRYGSREYEVLLDTVPSHCQAWVVPNPLWVSEREKLLALDPQQLKKCDAVTTPRTVNKLPYQFVFLAKGADGTVMWREFKPSRDKVVTIEFVSSSPPDGTSPVPAPVPPSK